MIRCRQRVDIQSGFADVLCSGVRLRRPCAELLIVWTELSEGQEDISIRVGCHVSAREAGDSRGESTERTQREELLHWTKGTRERRGLLQNPGFDWSPGRHGEALKTSSNLLSYHEFQPCYFVGQSSRNVYIIPQIVQLLSIKGKSREGSKEKAFEKFKQGFKQREIYVKIWRFYFWM